jgi:hypothetical protein
VATHYDEDGVLEENEESDQGKGLHQWKSQVHG